MKNKLSSGLIKTLIVFFMFVLLINSYVLFKEIKREVTFQNRSYGLTVMNDCFDNGEYYKIYTYTLKNSMADEKPYVDVSQYEAFGRFYNAYLKAKMYPENAEYKDQMKKEKALISFMKILNVIAILEEDLDRQ